MFNNNSFAEIKPADDAWGIMPGGMINERSKTWNPSSGRFEPVYQNKPIQTMEIRYDRDQPSRAVTLPYIPGQDDADISPMWNNAINKSQKWQELAAASQDYSQFGTDIPDFSAGSGGAFATGSDFPRQGFGYQYQSPAIAQGLPVGQDPNFRDGPMSQEDFSEMVNYGLDLKHGPRFRTAPAAAPVGPQLPRFFKPV